MPFPSKHVLNAQVAIRSPCCRKWFDCAECHTELEPSHALAKSVEMVFACKKCKKCFRKDAQEFDETDEYCPHCDNHFVIDALTPTPRLEVVGEDVRIDSRYVTAYNLDKSSIWELKVVVKAKVKAKVKARLMWM
jgi:uncharacterized CHY-type Zn-finger protein